MKLKEISARLSTRLQGDGNIDIARVIGIEEALEGDLTFVANPKYAGLLKDCRASAVILDEDAPEINRATLRCKNPYLAFAQSVELFYRKPQPPRTIHPTAVIDEDVKLGANASIGAYVTIAEGVVVGDNVTIYPHVDIYPGVRIGNDVTLHSKVILREEVVLGDRVIVQDGAVIGADGFGFAERDDGSYYKIVQSGTVVLEDDVEVGANSTIDRATVGQTLVARGAKIDNLVQVGHGCVVGEHSLLAAQVGLAGSTVLGKKVILAGQVGVAGHLRIGDHTIATAQTGIPSSLQPNSMVSGYPAIDNLLWRKASIIFAKLPELVRRVRRLEKASRANHPQDGTTRRNNES